MRIIKELKSKKISKFNIFEPKMSAKTNAKAIKINPKIANDNLINIIRVI